MNAIINWFLRWRGLVVVSEFELERLQSCEEAWHRCFVACRETGWNADEGGTAMDGAPAHIRRLAAERDQLWLEIDPESAVSP